MISRITVEENVNQISVIEPETVRVVTVGIPGPPGTNTLRDEQNPQLGGDLNLNGHQITGEISSAQFILDGGLLG